MLVDVVFADDVDGVVAPGFTDLETAVLINISDVAAASGGDCAGRSVGVDSRFSPAKVTLPLL